MRHTKIVATIGPASASADGIRALLRAGVDVFRLNFSHGSHESHAAVIGWIRAAAEAAGREIAILQDLSGPKIRTGLLAGGQAIPLHDGATLRIATGDFVGEAGRVSTTYAELARAVHPGAHLLLDDGRIELAVESTDGTEIVTKVVNGGDLGEHKGINAPGVSLPASSITPKDEADLAFGLLHGVDLVALSFVQTAEDVARARGLIDAAGRSTPIIAKIERPEAVERIDAILEVADGVMVARGDLGLELPLERVPQAQKAITRAARTRGKPVIVATQVFESMRTEPRPTRAEVSDAANAVDDGVDAIMLSGETAIGSFPTRVVETLDAVIRAAESTNPSWELAVGERVSPFAHSRALCESAVTLADHGQARAIVAATIRGRTARVLSAYRPAVPVLAVTPSAEVARRLALVRGVVPFTVEFGAHVTATEAGVERELLGRGAIAPGDVVVFVRVHADLGQRDANFLHIFTVGH